MGDINLLRKIHVENRAENRTLVQGLINDSNNPVWAAETQKWDLVRQRLNFNNPDQVLEAFAITLDELKASVMSNEALTAEDRMTNLYSILSMIVPHPAFAGATEAAQAHIDKILNALIDIYKYEKVNSRDTNETRVLVETLLRKPATLKSIKVAKVLLETYVSDLSNDLDCLNLLTKITSLTHLGWRPSSDGNGFLKALIYNYVNQEGEKQKQIEKWITATLIHPNFQPTVQSSPPATDGNAIISYMLHESILVSFQMKYAISQKINGWISDCVNHARFQVSGTENQFVKDVEENMDLFSDASVSKEVDFRRLLLDWIKIMMDKNREIQQSLRGKYNVWEQSYDEEKEFTRKINNREI